MLACMYQGLFRGLVYFMGLCINSSFTVPHEVRTYCVFSDNIAIKIHDLYCHVHLCVVIMSDGSDEEIPFGTPAEEDDATTAAPRAKSVPIVSRPGGKPLYGDFPKKIRIDTPQGVLTFPRLAYLHDVLGDGNCCFRVMASLL